MELRYGNNELAVISFSGPATVKITRFLTELLGASLARPCLASEPLRSYYDYLEVAGSQLSGTDLELPKLIEVPAGQQRITWLSDQSPSAPRWHPLGLPGEGEGGWTFELHQLGESATFTVPPMPVEAGPAALEVVAAYGKTELWARARRCEVEDFDAETMAPSRWGALGCCCWRSGRSCHAPSTFGMRTWRKASSRARCA